MPQPADGQGFKIQDDTATDSRSTAERLKELRQTFPDMPLAERVAALTALARGDSQSPR